MNQQVGKQNIKERIRIKEEKLAAEGRYGVSLRIISLVLLVVALPIMNYIIIKSMNPEALAKHGIGGFLSVVAAFLCIAEGIAGMLTWKHYHRTICIALGNVLLIVCIFGMIFLKDLWALLLPIIILDILYLIASRLGTPTPPENFF